MRSYCVTSGRLDKRLDNIHLNTYFIFHLKKKKIQKSSRWLKNKYNHIQNYTKITIELLQFFLFGKKFRIHTNI